MAVSTSLQKALNQRVAVKIVHVDTADQAEAAKAKLIEEGFDAKITTFNNGTKKKPVTAFVIRAYERKI